MTANPAWLLIIAGLAVVGIGVVWLLAPSIKVASVKMACAQRNSQPSTRPSRRQSSGYRMTKSLGQFVHELVAIVGGHFK